MNGRILVIGSLNIDMVVKINHTPVVGETIISTRMDIVPGGKGANQACAVGRLEGNVIMLGAVGNDTHAKLQMESLSQAGADVSHMIVREDVMTGIAFITVNQDGDNSIVVVSGANATLSPRDIEEHAELFDQSEIVLLQLEIPLETVCYAAKLAKSKGKTVILDPAPIPEVFPEELFRYVDIIKPNRTELSMLTGIDLKKDDLSKAVGMLKEKGIKEVLVTLGDEGVYIDSDSCGVHMLPAHRVTVLDTTAAGDSFAAALAHMLAQGKDILEAAKFANAVSALVVTKKGAQTSMPVLAEVLAYIDEGKD